MNKKIHTGDILKTYKDYLKESIEREPENYKSFKKNLKYPNGFTKEQGLFITIEKRNKK